MNTIDEKDPVHGAILGREKVEELIEKKKDYLAKVFKEFEPEYDDAGLYQTPDMGWQVNFRHSRGWNYAAMIVRPDTSVVIEVHAGICEEWYHLGGAWHNGRRGGLGWPISDEQSCGGANRISLFENGTIFWDASHPAERKVMDWNQSFVWFTEESSKGHPWAQKFLGDCYLKGLGVKNDFGLAFKWFNAARENGISEVEPFLQEAARQYILSV